MNEKILLLFFSLLLVVLFTRIGPLSIGKLLKKQPWMERIAEQLPCMILILLLFHSGETAIASKGIRNFLPFTAGMIGALFIQKWKKQAILSISSGVAAYAVCRFFMHKIL